MKLKKVEVEKLKGEEERRRRKEKKKERKKQFKNTGRKTTPLGTPKGNLQ